jgi:hypothetical protein
MRFTERPKAYPARTVLRAGRLVYLRRWDQGGSEGKPALRHLAGSGHLQGRRRQPARLQGQGQGQLGAGDLTGSRRPDPQAGIVSWGIGCGEQGTPSVYASVAAEVCWIDNEVRSCIISKL